jgi:hypothetical protein
MPGGRHQIGIPAGFKSESVAGFLLECLAGFIGIRKLLRTPSQYLRERLVAAEAALSELRGGEREVNARIAATGASLVDSRAERFRLAVHAWTPGEDAAGANAALRQLVSG